MKVLFISSSNRGSINSIVKNQGKSIEAKGITVEYYGIVGKGLFGYLKNIPEIRKRIKYFNPDLIHAHFSLSAYAAALSSFFTKIKIVVSLMGSDTKTGFWGKVMIKFFKRYFWKMLIVKTEEMKRTLNIDNAQVIPNGVALTNFRVLDKIEARQKLKLNTNAKIVVWIADRTRYSKNFALAHKAIHLLNSEKDLNFLTLNNLPQEIINLYLNAADVLLLSSRYEGSPNIIKEAMACNCPVVATNVGDIRWLFGNIEGYFLTSLEVSDVASKIKFALDFAAKHNRTMGRDRIIELGLDAETTANKIIKLYEEILAG